MPHSSGADVKRVRLAGKLTQKRLGIATGYSEGYVSKVESGTVMPSMTFAEGQGIGRVIDSSDRVEAARNLFDRLRADALSPASATGVVPVRDSKDTGRTPMRLSAPAWSAFVDDLKRAEH
ncbi:DUF397 domain-containing protein [Streptomyces axinellae]|uniref:DUF397 domain-containing protein n=1 Tax=Streptomyces axinellae TaxID=552788 RepID=UPI003CD0A0DF